MRRTRPTFVLLRTVSAVGVLSLVASAQEGVAAKTAGPQTVNGSIALPNRWYTPGGCASRSGACATPAMLAQPVPGWQFEGKGPIVGEPLVWDDLVVVELHLGGERRVLQVLALADGAPVASKEFAAAESLAPALWNREVVVRVGKQLKWFLFGKGGFSEQRSSKTPAQFGPPLRLGNDLYVIVDGGVERWNATDLKKVWRYADERGFAGQVSVRGDSVFALRPFVDGVAVVEIDSRVGTKKNQLEMGLALAQHTGLELAVGPTTLVARLGPEAKDGAGTRCNAVILPLPITGTPDEVRLAHMVGAPALAEAFWVGSCGVERDGQLGLFRTGKDGVLLANQKEHAAFLTAPATVAGEMLYLGGVGVDAESLQVRWRLDVPAGARAVVARDALLFAADRRLVAFRDAAAAPLAAANLAVAMAWDDVLARRRQELLKGLAQDAMKGLELDFLDAVLARCRLEGVDEKWVAEQARLRASKSRLSVKKDAARLRALQGRADAVDADALAVVWSEIAKVPASAGVAHREALRFVLDADPQHAGTLAAVRDLLPAALRDSTPFDGREWLDYVVATDQVPVEFLAANEQDAGSQTGDQLELLKFRARWRKDLVALQSKRLIVYTPVTAPGSIARCLSLGELVCDTLEAMFAPFPAQRQDPRRMRLCLFESEREYKKHSGGGGHLAWTAGHYSPQEQLSRMFLPKDREAFARVMPVFVHELTHQWLEDRCPALAFSELLKRRPDQPGHWIVEGFASFVEQFTFDLARRTHDTDSRCDEHLDTLAHATAGQLLPWGKVLSAGHVEFSQIHPVPDASRKVTLGHRLGSYLMLSQRNCYYAQAGGLCHWLWHAEDGRHRRALLEFVLAYYGGDANRLDLGKTLGMTPEAIGAAVVAHSKSRQP